MALAIHADRRLPALVDAQSLAWMPSPEPGVERRMLERSGDEVAVATSIVRYAPNSRFPEHTHALGEEFLVLAGTFSDGEGDYPTGTYVRNPAGSRHAPRSAGGCVIFVKLRQMQDDEPQRVRDHAAGRCWQRDFRPGIDRAALYANERQQVALLRMAPGATLPARETPGGEELLVIEGLIELPCDPLPHGPWTWSRSAAARQPAIHSGSGALLWHKRGHL